MAPMHEQIVALRSLLWDALEVYNDIGQQLVMMYIRANEVGDNPDALPVAVAGGERLIRLLHDGEQLISEVTALLRDVREAALPAA